MSFIHRVILTTIPGFLFCGFGAVRIANAQAAIHDEPATAALPKAFSCPAPSTLGDVPLRIVIDANGGVSSAKALHGPQTLVPAAESCAKTWKFDRLPSAPLTETVLLRYQTKDCPARDSEHGELQYSWGLRDRSNLVLAYVEGQQPPAPPYPEEERKAGIAGRMAVLVSLNADGTVKDARVVQGLSPAMDKGVVDELRSIKFKLLDGVSEMQVQGLLFQAAFHATCTVPAALNYVE